jgi:putative ATPase
MDTLFTHNTKLNQPLAERLRPQTLANFLGQPKLVGPNGMIRRMIEQDHLVSLIFWGPSGTGKTTLAHIIAEASKAKFISLSAVTSGVKDLRDVIAQAKTDQLLHAQKTILFVDEIHRWNKSQQDALLPHIEQGTVTLIGATTENPSFELNSALLSRCQVVVFEKLNNVDLIKMVQHAVVETCHGMSLQPDIIKLIVNISDGDGRVALNTIELLQQSFPDVAKITTLDVKGILEKIALRYDKTVDEHYNIISALHKTMRANDVNAALYWCGRMVFAGEDPLYIMRRVVEFASEDIGNADPQALVVCQSAYQTVHALGIPEGQYAIFQAVAYCAQAKKSRAVYQAAKMIETDIKDTPNSPVPMHLRNAPTALMKQFGYGQASGEANLPTHLQGKKYFKTEPTQ